MTDVDIKYVSLFIDRKQWSALESYIEQRGLCDKDIEALIASTDFKD